MTPATDGGRLVRTLGKQLNRKLQAKREAQAKAKRIKNHRAYLDERQGRKERRDREQ